MPETKVPVTVMLSVVQKVRLTVHESRRVAVLDYLRDNEWLLTHIVPNDMLGGFFNITAERQEKRVDIRDLVAEFAEL